MIKTMKKRIYSTPGRIIIRSLFAIFMIITIVFGVLSAYILAMVGPDEIFSDSSVSETKQYQHLVDGGVLDLQNSLALRRIFEENGEMAMDKTIDIMNPWEIDESKQNENTTFTLSELLSIKDRGVFDRIESIRSDFDMMEVPIYFDGNEVYDDEYEYQELDFSRREELLIDRMSTLQLPMPISEIPLMKYAKDNEDGVTPLEICYALYDISVVMYEYNDAVWRSSAAGTNLRYFIKDNVSNQVISNGGWQTIKEAQKAAKEWGTFIEYQRSEAGFKIVEESNENLGIVNQRLKQDSLISKNEEVIITIDKNYPSFDQLAEFSYSYTNLKPNFETFLWQAIQGLIISIGCLILATITTGQKESKGAVHLNAFDKIPTEIGASLVCALGLMALGVCLGAYNDYGHYISDYVRRLELLYLMGVLITAAIIAMWGYLSLVRRIKAKDLWKNSLLKKIVDILKRGYESGRMSTRWFLACIGVVIGQVFLIDMMGMPGIVVVGISNGLVFVYLLKEVSERQALKDGIDTIAQGDLDYKIDTTRFHQDNQEMAEAVNQIAVGMQKAVAKSMKNERMRSELITNVSHDIKTPLTSIINYVDLLKRENIDNPQVKGYIDILDAKSQRLKHLTEDLVEASKVSSGNVELHMDKLNLQELLVQAEGEVVEKLAARSLEVVSTLTEEPVIIRADGQQLWRVFENLLNNIVKYALEGTRVYIDLAEQGGKAVLMFKNMSQESLNINADELTERFVRGDISRTTEGSGLGLSIAKNLTEMQGGEFDIYLDGDLFKVTISFDMV